VVSCLRTSQPKPCKHLSPPPCVQHIPPPYPPWFNHPNNIRWRIQAVKFIIMQFSPWSIFLPSLFKIYTYLYTHIPDGLVMGRESAVGIATADGLDDRRSEFDSRRGWKFFSSPPRPDRLWAHPASYPMGTGGSFPGGKAARAWSWPLISIQCRRHTMRGAILPLPNKSSWRGA
jgi:hypothetical protein